PRRSFRRSATDKAGGIPASANRRPPPDERPGRRSRPERREAGALPIGRDGGRRGLPGIQGGSLQTPFRLRAPRPPPAVSGRFECSGDAPAKTSFEIPPAYRGATARDKPPEIRSGAAGRWRRGRQEETSSAAAPESRRGPIPLDGARGGSGSLPSRRRPHRAAESGRDSR